MTTKRIPAQNIGQLRFRIDQLNARAEKLGVGGIEYHEITSYCISPAGIARKTAREVIEIEITGGRVGLGWNLLGVIEHTDAGNILRAAPGATIPESYRTAPRECDHCGTARQRTNTFLAETPDGGSIVQLGRSCLRDYLGHIDAEQLAGWLESVAELIDGDDEGWGGGGRVPTYVLEVVAAAAADYRLRGRYVPVRIDDSTIGRVADWLAPDSKFRREFIRKTGFAVDAEDVARARELIDWVATAEGGNGYIENLRVVAAAETVKSKNIGILVSITAAHRTAAERSAEQVKRDAEKAERDAAKAAADADRADAPTGRVDIVGTVERLTEREGEYGLTYKMIVETDDGWRLWVTQPTSLFEIPEDDGDHDRLRSVIEGERVAMTVTVTPSDDDPKFAFGKRPAKAVLVS